MKKIYTLIILVTVSLSIFGCGTKSYQVTTKNGQKYTAMGALEYDVQSQTYTFENEEGKQIVLEHQDVDVIQEKKE
ncbi:YgdI/YgdR family lipoprotein [Pseudodesulfovibrio piezophilus]|uniref:Lipoprotein YgdI/YgdR-like SH3-like domain-containing protein n=1 Tax=Pseudodesulfovibrio piezophilus (strain DSM 21447 / JCM 15486 / C1TLV30) TaxID=1322246 RepID=M1WNC1_PSEP2|nr:YgdI/YgdR family lipoprotein [Pseudodesulfovibrio piezophilus]CCH47479.1 conserved exported protein of unknown function [Pseudodesulfovibrio piezophilus C1TLV30]